MTIDDLTIGQSGVISQVGVIVKKTSKSQKTFFMFPRIQRVFFRMCLLLILKAMNRCRNPALSVYKILTGIWIHRHNRRIS